eukprot:1694287-Alexandrium_andersonii.AAC.1
MTVCARHVRSRDLPLSTPESARRRTHAPSHARHAHQSVCLCLWVSRLGVQAHEEGLRSLDVLSASTQFKKATPLPVVVPLPV